MSKRITGEKVDVDYSNIHDFFEERGAKKNFGSKYNYVLFQDDNPELAEARDKQEKEKIAELLGLENGQTGKSVLDIGCGIGRWGEYLLEHGLHYVGIDGSRNLIEIAKDNLKAYDNKTLLVGFFQQFPDVLREAGQTEKFDYIFINGVFMYLNDADFQKALMDIVDHCAENCIIYVKESMGLENRLTLDDIYSEGLKQDYTAIYRSIAEYRNSFQTAWADSFELVSEGLLFEEKLINRKETADYYFIWKR